jgi:c-di-GMP-binding flagellar brake protein YcgR
MAPRSAATEILALKSLSGQKGRLIADDPRSPDGTAELPCTVSAVNGPLLRVALVEQVPLPEEGAQVVLEVATRQALVQCFTVVERREEPVTLFLRRPARTHVLQRRRYPRADTFVAATYQQGGAFSPYPAQLINLSVDGAAMVVVDPLQFGSVITLNLGAIGLKPEEVPARVVRCTPSPNHLWVIGLSFGRLPPEQEESLAAYIVQLTGGEGAP